MSLIVYGNCRVQCTTSSVMHRFSSDSSLLRHGGVGAGRAAGQRSPAVEVSRLPHPCGKVHQAGPTGRQPRGTCSILRCSRFRLDLRDSQRTGPGSIPAPSFSTAVTGPRVAATAPLRVEVWEWRPEWLSMRLGNEAVMPMCAHTADWQ